MKVSEISDVNVAQYIGLQYEDLTTAEILELNTILTSAKAYISSYTGLTALDIDTHEDFTIVVYILCQDMHDNKTLYVEKNNMNKVVETILGMYCVNLL